MVDADAAQDFAVNRSVEDVAGTAKSDDRHARGKRGLCARRRILDRETRGRIDPETLCGSEIDVGMRLAAIPAIGAVDMLAEMMAVLPPAPGR